MSPAHPHKSACIRHVRDWSQTLSQLDVEGMECDVLDGSRLLLADSARRPRFLQVEAALNNPMMPRLGSKSEACAWSMAGAHGYAGCKGARTATPHLACGLCRSSTQTARSFSIRQMASTTKEERRVSPESRCSQAVLDRRTADADGAGARVHWSSRMDVDARGESITRNHVEASNRRLASCIDQTLDAQSDGDVPVRTKVYLRVTLDMSAVFRSIPRCSCTHTLDIHIHQSYNRRGSMICAMPMRAAANILA